MTGSIDPGWNERLRKLGRDVVIIYPKHLNTLLE